MSDTLSVQDMTLPEAKQHNGNEIAKNSKAGKCGITLYEYACRHSERLVVWNTRCGDHSHCDPYSVIMEVVSAPCGKCSLEIGMHIADMVPSLKLFVENTNPGLSRDVSPVSDFADAGALSDIEDAPAPSSRTIPVNDENQKITSPALKLEHTENIEKQSKIAELQATTRPFVPIQASFNGKSHEITITAPNHEDTKMNGERVKTAEQQVNTPTPTSIQNPNRFMDRCSKFDSLAFTHVDFEDEVSNTLKQTKYTPPMLWKQASASLETNKITFQPAKLEIIQSKGKLVNGVEQGTSTLRVALGPVSNYANRAPAPAFDCESFEDKTDEIKRVEKGDATSFTFSTKPIINNENSSLSFQASESVELKGHLVNGAEHQANTRSLFASQKPASNETHRNKVPFLQSKPESIIAKEETTNDAEADKLKKLQKTLATLAITQEVEAIFRKVQVEQKIKLEDWFANLAPMHFAAMQKAAAKRDRDAQVQSLRASFADNGKFLGGMLVDRLLEDAKEEVVKKCEEGVEKLLDSLL